MRRIDGEKGQVLVAVLILLTVLSILVPVMVSYVQNEAKWTAKQGRTTTAFHQAEAGTEKALLTLTLTTQTWVDMQNCNNAPPHPCSPVGFRFDTQYTDIAGGRYVIYITSGPGNQQATVLSVGQDANKKETRALKVILANAPLGNVAIYAGNGISITGGVTVEWGAVVTPVSIDFGGAIPTYPQAFSAGNILPTCTSPATLCDSPYCHQWHCYYANIPPAPIFDLAAFKASATASGTYFSGNQTWGAAGGPQNNILGQVTYIDGDLYVNSSNKMNNFVGTLIVMGNFSSANGSWGNGCPGAGGTAPMYVPQTAWMQYGNNWAHYQAFGVAGTPAVFPTLQSAYLLPATATFDNCTPNKTALSGLMYVQGNFVAGGGGGSTDVYGSLYVVGSSTASSNSGVTIYYNSGATQNLQTTNILLSRTWWQDVVMQWPGPP